VSVTYVPAHLRRAVMVRAHHVCEYCLLDEEDTFFGLEVDHIIAEKHGGETTNENLACACLTCNRNKGSDIATLEPGTRNVMRLYRPHEPDSTSHFDWNGDCSIASFEQQRTSARARGFSTCRTVLVETSI
jgi:5-methylcytosine-specific restriction endonuclease McrA